LSQANELTQQIIAFIFQQGGFAWRASSTGIFDQRRGIWRSASKKGVADILACYRGILVACEVKIGKDKLSFEQSGFLQNIEHCGGLSVVAKDFDQFKDWWFIHTSA